MSILNQHSIIYKIAIALLVICSLNVKAENLQKVLSLAGDWYFAIGDNMQWSENDFNHTQWEQIQVPGQWERQGFNGYDGYAWYRKTFTINESWSDLGLYLSLGYIDDVDEVYLNGQLMGHTGTFPFDFSTAYNAKRLYPIPGEMLNKNGVNTIAVRVYDAGSEGGIVDGIIGIVVDADAIPVDVNLQGKWKFIDKDVEVVKNEAWNFSLWSDILVPGLWEDQGYKGYDGTACYATTFDLKNKYGNELMVLLLGKIDDLDQVFLNGVLIAQSPGFTNKRAYVPPDFFKQSRGYYIPQGILKANGENVLLVKVFDQWGNGGIYEGSIGLITQKNYINYWRTRRSSY